MFKSILFAIIIVAVTSTIVTFLTRFSIIMISGNSMYPTYKNGRFVIADRRATPSMVLDFDKKCNVGRVFIYTSPTGNTVIKRLTHIKTGEFGIYALWFEGDNSEHSMDSRAYGYVNPSDVLGEVVTVREATLRILGKGDFCE